MAFQLARFLVQYGNSNIDYPLLFCMNSFELFLLPATLAFCASVWPFLSAIALLLHLIIPSHAHKSIHFWFQTKSLNEFNPSTIDYRPFFKIIPDHSAVSDWSPRFYSLRRDTHVSTTTSFYPYQKSRNWWLRWSEYNRD